jgi:hypothetical protein
MKKPNLFIVGAARSGTTSLWQYLRQHPSIYMPEDELYKEPSFFCSIGAPMGMDKYLSIFSAGLNNHDIVGEASTAYLTDPSSAKKLYDFNPEAKIIILLRNPADRAYSLYSWMVGDGYEYASTFDEALELEQSRRQNNIPNWFEPQYYWNYMYFQSGLYYEQVKRYLELFGNNVMIIKFEHFRRHTQIVYDNVCAFLGLEKHELDLQIHNQSPSVLSSKIQFLLRKLNHNFHETGKQLLLSGEKWPFVDLYCEYAEKLSSVAPFSLKDKLLSAYVLMRLRVYLNTKTYMLPQAPVTKIIRDILLNIGLTNKKPWNMNRTTKTGLMAKSRPDIVQLAALTDMDFTDWLTS